MRNCFIRHIDQESDTEYGSLRKRLDDAKKALSLMERLYCLVSKLKTYDPPCSFTRDELFLSCLCIVKLYDAVDHIQNLPTCTKLHCERQGPQVVSVNRQGMFR